jgi:hypothetical protein
MCVCVCENKDTHVEAETFSFSHASSPSCHQRETKQELELLEIKLDGEALPWDGKAFVVTGEQDLLVFGAYETKREKGRVIGLD